MSRSSNPSPPGRREVLRGAGALGLGALAAPAALATPPLRTAAPKLNPIAGSGGLCSVTPSATPGPFYLASDIQSDITDGKQGLPLQLFFKIVRASDCSKLPGAEVDVWQADALGTYSGFAVMGTQGEDFLRGTQVTNTKGLVGFQSIYPGLYPDRCAHVHVKVRPQPGVELTTQVYFPDIVTRLVHQHVQPYTSNPSQLTTNAADTEFTAETILNLDVVSTPVPGILGWLILAVDI